MPASRVGDLLPARRAEKVAGVSSRLPAQQFSLIYLSRSAVHFCREMTVGLVDPFVVRSDSPVEYGIHLMACYFIVHHHGGRIDARSEEGKGTTFTLRMPLNPAQASPLQNEQDFFQKVLMNDRLWEKLISSE
jgi:hypothetical protein